MSQPLRITPQGGRGGCFLRLSGVVDESFDRRALLDHLKGPAVLDMDEVHRITSFGVREWLGAIRDFPPDYFCFVRCRPVIVSQFNMVANFGGRGEVVSFYAPYVCTICSKEVQILVDLRRQYDLVTSIAPPNALCPDCGGEAEFDDLPDSYFSYVSRQPAPNPPAFVQALIDGTGGGGFRIEKEVGAGPITALWLHGDLDRTARLKRVADGLEGTLVIVGEGLISASAAGLLGLATMAATPNVDPYLARLRPNVMLALSGHPARDKLRVVSLLLPFRCPGCRGEAEIDIGATALAVIVRSGKLGKRCASCGEELQPAVSASLLAAAAALPLVPIPDVVARYFADRKAEARTTAQNPLLFGRYDVVGILGTGGMGELLLARQNGLEGFEKLVALKRIKRTRSTDPGAVENLLSEAKLAARISHPNVVQIFDLGKADGEYYIAMEFVRGWDLAVLHRTAMALDVKWPIEFACRVVSDVCAGLTAAHNHADDDGKANPIIHRDVSPHNVLVSVDGAVKLTDFGIAKAMDSSRHTEPGIVKGKMAYVAPEQIQPQAGREVGPRADVFSAGILLYELISGKHLFRRPTAAATLRATLDDEIPAFEREVPKELTNIVLHALERDPARRYATARQLEIGLDEFLSRLGRASTSMLLAEWVKALVEKGIKLGKIPRDSWFTPSSPSVTTLDRPDPDSVPTNIIKVEPKDGKRG